MSSNPAVSNIDSVRFLVGDTVDPAGAAGTLQLNDSEIRFALDQNSNIYGAAAICARALSARYARKVDTKFETIDTKYSQLRDNFEMLARQLDQQAKKRGGLGEPIAGGISRSDVETVDLNADRVKPFFYDNLFNNPPASNDR